MTTENPLYLGEKEYEIIELLQSLEVSRTEATAITCLLCQQELTSQAMERASGLRQPEVSVAMRPLRERGWIQERSEKKTNEKGRPLKYYRLTVPFMHIVETFEEEFLVRTNEVIEAIARLRELRQR